MKKKFLAMFSIVFVLAFAAAVYAFNQTNNADNTTASSCAKKDNCPLKNKNATASATKNASHESCCDKADCCCKTGACPMKAKGENASGDCCGNCCGGSCPMKNKQSETAAMQTEGASCHHNKTAGS